jgi:hypothetical protein
MKLRLREYTVYAWSRGRNFTTDYDDYMAGARWRYTSRSSTRKRLKSIWPTFNRAEDKQATKPLAHRRLWWFRGTLMTYGGRIFLAACLHILKPSPLSTDMISPTALDLFSGCGGLTLGLKQAAFKVLWAVDNDELSLVQ